MIWPIIYLFEIIISSLLLAKSIYCVDKTKIDNAIIIGTCSTYILASLIQMFDLRYSKSFPSFLYRVKLWILFPLTIQALSLEHFPYLFAFSICYTMMLVYSTNIKPLEIDSWIIYFAMAILVGHSISMIKDSLFTVCSLMTIVLLSQNITFGKKTIKG